MDVVENQEPHRSDAEHWLLRCELDEAKMLQKVIDEARTGLGASWPRNALAACSFEVCIEHARAVAHLFESRFDGSAMALVRSVFEAFIRGVWIQVCASERQLDRLVEDKLQFPSMRCLIAGIERCDAGFHQRTMSALHADSWGAMNDYTHTGMLQLSRRMRDGEMTPDYDTGSIVEALRSCASFALLAAQQSCLSGGNLGRAAALIDTMDSMQRRVLERQEQFERLQAPPVH